MTMQHDPEDFLPAAHGNRQREVRNIRMREDRSAPVPLANASEYQEGSKQQTQKGSAVVELLGVSSDALMIRFA